MLLYNLLYDFLCVHLPGWEDLNFVLFLPSIYWEKKIAIAIKREGQ